MKFFKQVVVNSFFSKRIDIYFITILFFFICITRIYLASVAGEEFVITLVPDDAFYYLKIAENNINFGIWSFDRINSVSGYHILYAYFCKLILYFTNLNFLTLFILISLLSSIILTISLYLTIIFTKEKISKSYYLVSIIPYFYSIVIMQSTMMVESPFVIFFLILNLFIIFNKKINLNKKCLLFFIGLFGSLARLDFGGSTLILFIFFYVSSFYNYNIYFKNSLLSLTGSCVGVLLSFLHNKIHSGQFLQGSSNIKYFWSALEGHSYAPILSLFKSIFYFSYTEKIVIFIHIFIFILFFCYIYNLVIKKKINSTDILLFSSIGIILFYIFFYSFNSSAIQPWYIVYFILPLGLIYNLLFEKLFNSVKIQKIIFLLVLFLLFIITRFQYPFNEIWVHQRYSYEVAKKLNHLEISGPIGSWNAGLFSYFSNKKIINIDGLVNNNIQDYIKNNKLLLYLIENKIYYILDSEYMMTEKNLKKRGGYLDENFKECFKKLKTFNSKKTKWKNVNISLYEMKTDCRR